jgi:hypothetical protein
MYDNERDPRVADLLTGAADEAATYIQPRGVDAVVRTVHRRRVRTIGVVTAVVVAAVVAPLTVVSLTGRPAPATTGDHPSPSASPSASPSPASPSPTDSPGASGAPNGRIPADQLRNATLRIPAWPKGFDDSCPTGTVKFSGGKAGQGGIAALQGDPVYVDVDHDGAQETVVLVVCSPQGSDYQVLALDRDTSGGIVTLGKVVGSAGNTGKQGTDIMTVWSVAAGDNGQVRVDVGEYRPCCESAQASQHQWRAYGWDGTRFTQTGGPTTFGPNPNVTDLTVTADPLTMTKQGDGSWAGTLRVTIHNAAKFPVPGRLRFALDLDPAWVAQPDADCHFTPGEQPLSCTVPGIAAGTDRVLTIQLTAPAGPLATRCDVYAGAVTADGLGYPDRKPRVSATVPVTAG